MQTSLFSLARGLLFLLAPGAVALAAALQGPTLETITSTGNRVSLVDKAIPCEKGKTMPSEGEWPDGRELRLDGAVAGCWWTRGKTIVLCPEEAPMCYVVPAHMFKPRESV